MCKRLASHGVISVKDLQEYPLEDLVQELGANQATVVHQLAMGIDDSPVIAYGKPLVCSFGNLRDHPFNIYRVGNSSEISTSPDYRCL